MAGKQARRGARHCIRGLGWLGQAAIAAWMLAETGLALRQHHKTCCQQRATGSTWRDANVQGAAAYGLCTLAAIC